MKLEEFRKLLKDALEHLYDTAYLEVHPFLSQVSNITTTNRLTRAQALRGMLKDAVEKLRPPEGLPSGSPEWRSYLVLRRRYIQGMTMGEVENELGLSRRQLQRETSKGLEALTSILWASYESNTASLPEDESISGVFPELSEMDPLEVELNQWKLVRQTCSVQSLINDTLWMLKPTMEQSQTPVVVNLPSVLPPVLVDSTLTRQALFKIMRLAVQHSTKNILLTAVAGDNFVTIQLQNPENLYCSDERDWQTAERIVSDQGGGLSLENIPSLGSQIAIRLPQAGQTRVLVIDDSHATLQLFERYLTPHHYEVRKAQGGVEGLSMVAENLPDLIILDVMMPTMDGWQVLRTLKQNPTTKNIPIVICSVLKEPDLAISLGAATYLKKPVDRLELLTTLEQLLHQ